MLKKLGFGFVPLLAFCLLVVAIGTRKCVYVEPGTTVAESIAVGDTAYALGREFECMTDWSVAPVIWALGIAGGLFIIGLLIMDWRKKRVAAVKSAKRASSRYDFTFPPPPDRK